MPKRKTKIQKKARVEATPVKNQSDAKFKEFKSELDALRKEKKSFKSDLSKMNKKVIKLTKIVTPPKRTQLDLLEEIEADLNTKHTVIKTMKHDLLEAQKRIGNTDKIFKAKDERIEELEITVSRLKRINADQRKYLIDLEESDQAKDAQIVKLRKNPMSSPASSQETPVMAVKESEEKAAVIAEEKAAVIAAKDAQIAHLKEKTSGLENSTRIKNGEIRGLQEEIFDLQTKTANLEESIKEEGEEESIAEKDNEIAGLKADIAWLKELNDTLKTQRRIVFVDKKD